MKDVTIHGAELMGVAARALSLTQADAVMGIPVGIYGKNIFFDRKAPGK